MAQADEIEILKKQNTVLTQELILLTEIVQTTDAIIVVLNIDTSIKFISKGSEMFLGYSCDEIMGKFWFETVVPKSKHPEFESEFKNYLKSDAVKRVRIAPAYCKDGSVKTISWRTSKIFKEAECIGTVAIGKDITAIQLEVNTLKESEEKFRTLAELLPTPVSCKTIDNKIIFLNKAYIQQFGYTLDDIPDFDSWLNLAYKTDEDKEDARKNWSESVTTLKNGEKTKTKIITVYTKSNEKKILKHDTTISGSNIYCSYQDITKQIEEEQILKENETKFKTLAELAPVPISFITTTGEIVYFNKAYIKHFGFTIDTVPTVKKLFDISYKDEKEKEIAEKYWLDDVKKLTQGESVETKRLIAYNRWGKQMTMEYSATISNGYIYYAYLDITAQVEKEKLLVKSKETFERIAENTPIPVGGCDIETYDLSFSNKKFEETFGLKYTDNISFDTWKDLLTYSSENEKQIKEAEFNNYVIELVNNKHVKNKILERRIKCKDESIRTFEIGLTFDNISLYAFFYDITSKKESEKELIENEKRFRNLAEQMHMPVSFITQEGKFVFVNKAFVKDFGYTIDKYPDIVSVINSNNSSAEIKLAGIKHWDNEIKQIFETKTPVRKQIEVETKSGEMMLVEYTGSLAGNYIYYVYNDITEQRNKEEKLIQSRNTFRGIAENTPIAIAGCNIDNFEVTFINKQFKNEFGYSIQEIKAFDDWRRAIIYNSNNEKEEALEKWFAVTDLFKKNQNTEIKTFERTLRKKDGSIGIYELGLTFDSRTVYAFFYDITERKKAEQKLSSSELRFRNIVENLPLPLVSINAESQVIYTNKRHTELIGHNNQDKTNNKSLNSFSINDLTDDEDKERFKSTIQLLQNNDSDTHIVIPTYTTKILCHDGKIRTFEISENIFGKTLYTLFNDITQQTLAREILAESEKKFRALAENIPMGIGSYDDKGKTTFVNNFFTKVTGYTLQDVPTVKEWYKRTQPKITKRLEFYAYWENLVNSYKSGKVKEPVTVISSALCKDGSFKHFNFSFSVYDNITYLLLFDITEQEKAKKQLEKSHQELRTLASYLQTIREEERKSISREIHDELGQHITGIKMDISSIFRKTKAVNADEELQRKEIIDTLNNTIKSVRKIATQLRPSILDDLGVIATFEWLIQDFKKRTGTNCNFYFSANEDDVTVEVKNHLFRILQESLTNIIRHAAATNVYIDFFVAHEKINLIIADDGKGFNQNSPKTTLGIIGMRERTAVIGGHFSISSEKNKGTRIIISIPIKK